MAPTNTTEAGLPSLFPDDTASKMLSWQSCFWAIVPIALNTMCQPSGRILGFDSAYNFTLRSSPIMCAVSAIDTFVQTIVYWTQKGSFIAGLQDIIDFRFEDCPTTDEGSVASLRKNQAFRLILLLPGALPQIVKLYACKGIPWTQACCTAYLASYVVDGIMIFLASIWLPHGVAAAENRRVQHVHKLAWFDMRVVLHSSFAAAYLFLAVGVTQLMSVMDDGYKAPFVVARTVISGVWMPIYLMRRLGILHTNAWIATLARLSFSTAVLTIPLLWTSYYSPNHFDLRYRLIVSTTACLVGTVSFFVDEEDWPFWNWFLLSHSLAALSFYACLYDGTSTYKPGWTNWLG